MDEFKRAPNFTVEEVAKLKNLVKKYSNKIECKKSDVVSNKQKVDAWKNIEYEFNSTNSNIFRSHYVLRRKWENIKKTCKKKHSELKMHKQDTDDGPSKTIHFSSFTAKFECDVECNEEYDNISKDEAILVPSQNISLCDIAATENHNLQQSVNNPSTSKNPQEEEGKITDVTDTADRSNYIPRLLKTPVTRELRYNSKEKQEITKKEGKKSFQEAKLELVELQKSQFIKESELRIRLMLEEHELKMIKLRKEIELMDEN